MPPPDLHAPTPHLRLRPDSRESLSLFELHPTRSAHERLVPYDDMVRGFRKRSRTRNGTPNGFLRTSRPGRHAMPPETAFSTAPNASARRQAPDVLHAPISPSPISRPASRAARAPRTRIIAEDPARPQGLAKTFPGAARPGKLPSPPGFAFRPCAHAGTPAPRAPRGPQGAGPEDTRRS